jgi:hypothetical protein
MKMYLIIAISDSAEIKASELFLEQEPALDRTFELASELADSHSLNWVDPQPAEEILDDGSRRWVFLETNKQFAGCYHLEVNEHKGSLLTKNSSATDVVVPQITLSQIKSRLNQSRLDRNLPGGFYGKKPMKMGDLIDNPYSVDPASSLSVQQKVALVTARIRAIPDYSWITAGCVCDKAACLNMLSIDSIESRFLIAEECDFLDELRDDRIDSEIANEEEESSSSSEDE